MESAVMIKCQLELPVLFNIDLTGVSSRCIPTVEAPFLSF